MEVAKRKNRTLDEMIRNMLQRKRLTKYYLNEVISTTIYIQNRCPIISLENMIPYEAWYGIKLNVTHLKMFGCLTFVKIVDEKRKKLDAKNYPCVFIGYNEHSKAYKFYNPKTHQTIISRDVIFYEGEVWGNKRVFVDYGTLEDTSPNVQVSDHYKNIQAMKSIAQPYKSAVPPKIKFPSSLSIIPSNSSSI